MNTLLIEIGTEELPPKALNHLGLAFAEGVRAQLAEARLLSPDSVVHSYAAPRRLAVQISQVLAQAPTQQLKIKVLPVAVALDAKGVETPALRKKLTALGFADTPISVLITENDGKADSFYVQSEKSGAHIEDAAQTALSKSVAALPIPKLMNYQLADGATTVQFVRPATTLTALYGERVLPLTLLGLTAGQHCRGHRFQGEQQVLIKSAEQYAQQLDAQGGVIAHFGERQQRIAQQLQDKAAALQLDLGDYQDLLAEVTALVEMPTVYVCAFEERYLRVPQECLILTMRTNQKYFPLFDREGKLSQHFLIVSNMRVADPSRIIEGNQRVVRPRLADAEFFFDTDKKTTLAARLPQLAQVVYHNQLGSQAERIKRVEAIATRLAQLPAVRAKYGDITGEVAEAARLCKADLLSLMVGEFASLQGIMGRYYAHNDGKSDAVADAIADHYKPRFAGDVLPRGGVGTVLALADKLETLIGLFGIGQVPTGDKDPFALRRHALGVLRLLRENQLAVDLRRDLIGPQIASFGALIKDPSEALVTYFAERLSGLMRDEGYSAQEVAAVQAVDEQVVLRVPERLQAVRAFSAMPEAAGLAAANKRVGNILKKADTADAVDSVDTDRRTVDVQLLHEPAEQALAQALAELSPRLKQYLAAQQYTDYLLALAALGKPVDQFFTDVMVNAEDPALKRNRLLLLTQLQSALRQVADLSALAG